MSVLRRNVEGTESENRSGFRKKGGAQSNRENGLRKEQGILMLMRELDIRI